MSVFESRQPDWTGIPIEKTWRAPHGAFLVGEGAAVIYMNPLDALGLTEHDPLARFDKAMALILDRALTRLTHLATRYPALAAHEGAR